MYIQCLLHVPTSFMWVILLGQAQIQCALQSNWQSGFEATQSTWTVPLVQSLKVTFGSLPHTCSLCPIQCIQTAYNFTSKTFALYDNYSCSLYSIDRSSVSLHVAYTCTATTT